MTGSVRLRNPSGGLSTAQGLPQRLQQHLIMPTGRALRLWRRGPPADPESRAPPCQAGSRGRARKVLRGLHCGSTVTWPSPARAHAHTHNCTPRCSPSHPTSCPQTWALLTPGGGHSPPEAENIGSFPENLYNFQRFPESLPYLITQISKPAGTEVR